MQTADILHPLTRLHWEECLSEFPGEHLFLHHPAATLRDRLYVVARQPDNSTCIYGSNSGDLTSWTPYSPPPDTRGFALVTYLSQLLLLGGEEGNKATDKVWSSNDGTDWRLTLPPMPTCRSSPLAVSAGPSPECVVVAGFREEAPMQVEVLVERQWLVVRTGLKRACYGTFHDGRIYYLTLQSGNREQAHSFGVVAHCSLEALLAACTPTQSGGGKGGEKGRRQRRGQPASRSERQEKLWEKSMCLTDPWMRNPISFGGRLVAVEMTPKVETQSLYAFCPGNDLVTDDMPPHAQPRMWVYVGGLPDWVAYHDYGSSMHPHGPSVVMQCLHSTTGDLVLIGNWENKHRVYRGSLARMSYDEDSQFSLSALCKLEAAGVPVMSSLAHFPREMASKAGISETLTRDSHACGYPMWDKTAAMLQGYLNSALRLWLSGKSTMPPTWRSLYEVMRRMNFVELSQQAQRYFYSTGMRPLKELCVLVITSALLQQDSLEPDRLHATLPDYVPPRDKAIITHRYKRATANHFGSE